MLPRRPLEQKAATAAKLDRRLAPLQKEAETAQRRADDLWKALADKKEIPPIV
jgi:predicted  nucleic acid-binding Zn-ribbon protein